MTDFYRNNGTLLPKNVRVPMLDLLGEVALAAAAPAVMLEPVQNDVLVTFFKFSAVQQKAARPGNFVRI